MLEEIQNNFLDFISHNFFVEKEEIDLEKSLMDEGIIDSFGLIEIASYIEKEYSINVQQDQVTRENFGSVVKIVNFIKNELTEREKVLKKAI